MIKEHTLNNFSYVRMHLHGLKTTIINYKSEDMKEPIVYEIHKEYACIQCGEEKEITVHKNGVTTDNQTSFFMNCVEESLCPGCYCNTDKAVKGAAENLMALH